MDLVAIEGAGRNIHSAGHSPRRERSKNVEAELSCLGIMDSADGQGGMLHWAGGAKQVAVTMKESS